MERINHNLARLLSRFRSDRKISQTELANLADVSRITISNVERGKQSVSLEMFCKITQALDKRPAELLDEVINFEISVPSEVISEANLSRKQEKSLRDMLNKLIV